VAKQLVCEQVTETVNVTQSYCEMVPYTTTVQVPVAAGCGGCGDGGPVMAGYGYGGGRGYVGARASARGAAARR
jgi:hypothetical protein